MNNYDETDEDYIASLKKIGFKDDAAQTLVESVGENIQHQSAEYWAVNFINQQRVALSEATKEVFMEMGFREDIAEQMMDNFSTTLAHEPACYWAVTWIHKFISSDELPLEEEYKPAPRNETIYSQTVWYMKFADRITFPYKDKDFGTNVKPNQQFDDGRFLFHGTKLDYAYNILQKGILVNKGEEYQDFSSGDGYYLNTRVAFAEEWADVKACKQKGQRAILVYYISASKLTAFPYEIFSNATPKWREFVKLCRTGNNTEPKVYEGPMCQNGQRVRHNGEDPQPHKPVKTQVCIRTPEVAAYFNGCLQYLFVW